MNHNPYISETYRGTINPANQCHREEYIRKLQRELFHMWGFLAEEGLWEDALDYLESHRNNQSPFEYIIQ